MQGAKQGQGWGRPRGPLLLVGLLGDSLGTQPGRRPYRGLGGPLPRPGAGRSEAGPSPSGLRQPLPLRDHGPAVCPGPPYSGCRQRSGDRFFDKAALVLEGSWEARGWHGLCSSGCIVRKGAGGGTPLRETPEAGVRGQASTPVQPVVPGTCLPTCPVPAPRPRSPWSLQGLQSGSWVYPPQLCTCHRLLPLPLPHLQRGWRQPFTEAGSVGAKYQHGARPAGPPPSPCNGVKGGQLPVDWAGAPPAPRSCPVGYNHSGTRAPKRLPSPAP